MKIDFVLPWVDPNDKNWQESRNYYSKANLPPNSNKSNSTFRFRDFETLKYVLRSIEYNCPWYNKIYLITEGHYPKWLDITNEKIQVITHQELYFNKQHLPIFNSSSIEMNILNIPNLSENFVYLNDDTIIYNPLAKSRFFTNGLPVDFISHGLLSRGKFYSLLKGKDFWTNALNNNIKLINSNNKINIKKIERNKLYHTSYSLNDKFCNFLLKNLFKKFFWFEHWHHPQAYCKQTLRDVYELYHTEMENCSKNKFRDSTDLTHYLYRYYHLSKGTFYPFKFNDGIIKNIDSINTLNEVIKVLENTKKFNFVCFNDSDLLLEKDFPYAKVLLNNFLAKKFPLKASFECKE